MEPPKTPPQAKPQPDFIIQACSVCRRALLIRRYLLDGRSFYRFCHDAWSIPTRCRDAPTRVLAHANHELRTAPIIGPMKERATVCSLDCAREVFRSWDRHPCPPEPGGGAVRWGTDVLVPRWSLPFGLPLESASTQPGLSEIPADDLLYVAAEKE